MFNMGGINPQKKEDEEESVAISAVSIDQDAQVAEWIVEKLVRAGYEQVFAEEIAQERISNSDLAIQALELARTKRTGLDAQIFALWLLGYREGVLSDNGQDLYLAPGSVNSN